MKVIALVSGGKDSCYCMHLCTQHGHEVVALANLLPEEDEVDELDSFMFQTVGHQLVEAYAACTGLPLFRKRTSGKSSRKEMHYTETVGDEVEDLHALLAYAKEVCPEIQAVASGAIASDYQRLRVENVCSRLGIVSLAYLWHQPQRQLLRSMVDCGIWAILVKVAALGLSAKHLGRRLSDVTPYLIHLADTYGSNACGEGGEYETLTLDCPAFVRAHIVLDNSEVVHASHGSVAPVAYLRPVAFHLEPKSGVSNHQLMDAKLFTVPKDWFPCTTKNASLPRSVTERSERGDRFRVSVLTRRSGAFLQLSLTPSTRQPDLLMSTVSESDVVEGLHATLQTLLVTLDDVQPGAGASLLGGSLNVHLYLANMGHFAVANNVYCKYFPTTNPPSRVCVQGPLPPHCPLQLDVLVALPPSLLPPPVPPPRPLPGPPVTPGLLERRVLHVQSISDWAPSCIGPYSQAVAHKGLIFMAGQLALEPGTMTLTGNGLVALETSCCLQHCQSVAVALGSSVSHASLGMTVFLSTDVSSEETSQVELLLAAFLEGRTVDCEAAAPSRNRIRRSSCHSSGMTSPCSGSVPTSMELHAGLGRLSLSGANPLSPNSSINLRSLRSPAATAPLPHFPISAPVSGSLMTDECPAANSAPSSGLIPFALPLPAWSTKRSASKSGSGANECHISEHASQEQLSAGPCRRPLTPHTAGAAGAAARHSTPRPGQGGQR